MRASKASERTKIPLPLSLLKAEYSHEDSVTLVNYKVITTGVLGHTKTS